jgi:hypothetical protein
MIRSRYIILFIFASCSSGLIPCPEPTTPLGSRNPKNPKVVEHVQTDDKKVPIKSKEKFTQHVTLEEWDCPRSTKKKYLPRSIKKNIKENSKRINEVPTDTIHTQNLNK